MRVYFSNRVANNRPPFRRHGDPEFPPKYGVVLGWPRDCACQNRIAVVGEGPGADEDQTGVPFVGRSGEELDRYLDAYNIQPDRCFITNIGRVFKKGNPDPTAEDIAMWGPLLREELNAARPYYIVAVGRISTRYFLGDVDMDTVHGIPFMVTIPWLDNGRAGVVVVVPVVHPAAGFRSTEAQAQTAYDFAQLSLTIQGKIAARDPETADRWPEPEYRELTDAPADIGEIQRALQGGTRAKPLKVAIDTEGLPGNPWGLSFSVRPGQAFVIRKVHRIALGVFYDVLAAGVRAGTIHILLHNSLHDLRVLRELNAPLPDGGYTDTMVLAYHLCVEPQGLKALAYRHCGMEMDSYQEVTQDAQDRIALEYYEAIEAMVSGGIVYRVPEHQVWEIKWINEEIREQFATLDMAGVQVAFYKTNKIRVAKPRQVTVPGEGPISVGPFRYIEPYTVRDRDKATGEMRERTKTPRQIDRRVQTALKEYREGKITAADIRNRWDNTDELVVQTVEEVIGPMREATMDDIPLPRAIGYAARDADATLRVEPVLAARHAAMDLGRVGEIDHATIPMVERMQAVGIQVDIPYLKALSVELESEMLAVQQEIKARFGVWINPNSGDQVADLLFKPEEEGGYGLEPTKKTKGSVDKETGEVSKVRGSTQDKVLEGMRGAHPIVPLILDYRGLNKAKTSFCDVAVREAVWEEHPVYDDEGTPTGEVESGWFIHCNFRITRVSSGRLSATKPNLMAVMGGDLGNRIRNGYIAGDGYVFSEWDLNQVEMRVMASEANDEFLISMFMNDEDIHTGTTDKMFKLGLGRPYTAAKKKLVKKAQRDAAKRTGFGVITGIQPKGLVDQMRLQGMIVSEEEAATWIQDWLAACPAVPVYMGECHREARSRGFVRDWAGRIRFLPGISSPFRGTRAEAGRQSHSHKIQGGAQEIMKIAMATIWREVLPHWWAKGIDIQPVLQIHDALMFRHKRLTDEQMAELDAQIRAALFGAAPAGFRVPLDAGGGSASKWGELEH